jgi:RNA polymerase sigma-70 factor (ECF subfamily)
LDIEDLVHEVFVVIARRFKEFRGEAQVTTWLFRVTQNVVRNRRRREHRWRWLTTQPPEAPRQLAVVESGPYEALDRSEARNRVYRVLDRLSEDHRNALILFEIEGLTGEEIAELTGVRPQVVFMRLMRARRQFARRIAELEGAP